MSKQSFEQTETETRPIGKQYISIVKLIEEFKHNGLIKDDDKQLNIYFDNWNESNKFKNSYSIRILAFVVVGSQTEHDKIRRISFKDFHELLPDVQNINIGKQLAKYMRKIRTASCRCVFVNLNQMKDKDYSYYPLKLSLKDYSELYNKLREERSAVLGVKPEFIEDIEDIDAL